MGINWRHLALLVFFAALGLAVLPCSAEDSHSETAPQVKVEFFEDPGCKICARIHAHVLPELELRFGDLYQLERIRTGVMSNYVRLARYQERFTIDSDETAVMIVQGRRAFGGWKQISEDLPEYVEHCILTGLEASAPPQVPPVTPDTLEADGRELLRNRVLGFTYLEVGLAGLADGINPCAISTIVFFLSLLAVFKVPRGKLVAVGVVFCLASFLTYTAIGFGLLNVLYLLQGYDGIRAAIEYVLLAALLILAWLSFLDAIRYKRSGKAEDVKLKLPGSIKLHINRVLRQRLGGGRLLTGSFLAGTIVTALEGVCTGQVYLPTLVLVAGAGGRIEGRATLMLLLYNTLFIVPLAAGFLLTLSGLNQQKLVQWSRQNVVISKVLLGLLFLGMAAVVFRGL